jgi:hypothetical protein
VLADLKDINKFKVKGEYIEYIAEAYVSKARRFEELNIPDFDAKSFADDLQQFLNDYIASYESKDEPITDRN